MKHAIYNNKEKLETLVASYKRDKKRIVFTNGCFDILHVGHLHYLQAARKLGDVLWVGLNSDQSVKSIKGDTRPINTETDRAELLMGLSCVDHVIIFNEETPYDLIKTILPHILVKGGDWKVDEIVGSDIVLRAGGEVRSLTFEDGYSTSQIIDKIKK